MATISTMIEGRKARATTKFGIDWVRGRSALMRGREEEGSRRIEENIITSRSTWNMPLSTKTTRTWVREEEIRQEGEGLCKEEVRGEGTEDTEVVLEEPPLGSLLEDRGT